MSPNNLFRTLVIIIALGSIVFPKEQNSSLNRLEKPNSITEAQGPTKSVLNINNIQIWVRNDGFFPWDMTATGTAGEYPKGTGGLIFSEGLLWGAKVNDGMNPRIRVNGCTYASGLKAGKVLYDAGGNVIGSDDPNDRHIWRVRPDFAIADLSADAAGFFVIPINDVTEVEIQAVYDQYEYDWYNWPADEGAPYEDVDNDGVYNPVIDIPGYPGASQTIWLVANDLPYNDGTDVSYNSYGSPPIGMEMQLTLWAYGFNSSNPLGNMLFKQAKLIYTGTTETPAYARLDTVYFTQWSDPDLGTYTDDYVGCDVDLSLGYVYNGNYLDDIFDGEFGIPVPAGGYDLLQGPVDTDGDTLGMTSFSYFGSGSNISDPDLLEYAGTLQWFNLMEGFLPRPEYPQQEPWIDPTTGEETKFALSGDPVTGTGWIDGIQLPPGDRRIVMASGPFEMALGDTQEVVLALVGGHGYDNLSSVNVLKYNNRFVQFAYDNHFAFPTLPSVPIVSASGLDEEIVLTWADESESFQDDGYQFEGYNVYRTASSGDPWERVATFDIVNGITVILDQVLDHEMGLVLTLPVQFGSDSGIQRFMEITTDMVGNPLVNGETYYFSVTAYAYNPDGFPKTLETDFLPVAVVPIGPVIGIDYSEVQSDSSANHTAGESDGEVIITVIDPTQVTGHDYLVTFEDDAEAGEILWTLTDIATNEIIFSAMPQLTSPDDQSTPLVDGLLVQVIGPPLEAKDWGYTPGNGTGTRWFSGAGDGEVFFGGVYLGPNFTGSNLNIGDYTTVEIRWSTIEEGTVQPGEPYTVDTSHPNASKAFMYRTWGSGNFTGFNDVPFSAWDVEIDPPRQLVTIVRDRDGNGMWNVHYINDDGTIDQQYNYIWVLDTDYDPTGIAYDPSQGGQDFMALIDEDGGPVQYGLWLAQRGTRDLFQDDGIFTIIPNNVNTVNDIFTFSTTAPTGFNITKGDVNGDGSIDVADVVTIINFIMQIVELTGEQEYASDFNSDLEINIADVVGIINNILGLSKSLVQSSVAEYVNISFPDKAVIVNDIVNVPINMNSIGDVGAMQVELTYDQFLLRPLPPKIGTEEWIHFNIVHNSPENGKVIYLFYSLNGETLPATDLPVFQFENLSKETESPSSIELVHAVISDIEGNSLEIEFGNRVTKTSALPETYALYPSYPNPFNPITNIAYDLPKESQVTIQVYNILGQRIRTLMDKEQLAGQHRIQWDGKNDLGGNISSGVYFINFKANNFTGNRK